MRARSTSRMHDVVRAERQPAQRPARAGDVEERHRDHADGVLVDAPLVAHEPIMPNRLRCDSMTPFGMPVVPDV